MKKIYAGLFIFVLLTTTSKYGYADVQIQPGPNWVQQLNALQPGNVAVLQPGVYSGGGTISLRGNENAWIIIRGANYRTTILEGDGTTNNSTALTINNSQFVMLEGVTVQNSTPDRDGTVAKCSACIHNEGVFVDNSDYITIQKCRFRNISTRGILGIRTTHLTVQDNLFHRVGDDTASADVSLANQTEQWVVSNNVFAGNTDGIVKGGSGTEGLVKDNIFVYHRWEDAIDFKSHRPASTEDPWSTIQNNVIYNYPQTSGYSGITVQNSTQNVRIRGNVIHGSAGDASVLIRGRCGDDPASRSVDDQTICVKDVQDVEVIGNWLEGSRVLEGIQAKAASSSATPTGIRRLWILNNVIRQFPNPIHLSWGDGIYVYNNIVDATIGSTDGATNILAATNLYPDTASLWPSDSSRIFGVPIFAQLPVGALAEGSPGKGGASYPAGFYLGQDVGFPEQEGNSPRLEEAIITRAAGIFAEEDIREALNQANIAYPYQIQDPASESLIIQGEDMGLVTDPDGDAQVWSRVDEEDGAGGRTLLSIGGSTTNPVGESVARFRVQFNRPDINVYYLYVRARNPSAGSSAGNSLWYPNGFDVDPSVSYFIPSTGQYSWINLGPYTPNIGRFQELRMGAREHGARLDVMVFHANNGLEASNPQLLDSLAGLTPIAFQQDPGTQGLISMEAENFDSNKAASGHEWSIATVPPEYTGASTMTANPDSGQSITSNISTSSPGLDYRINFVKTGEHYVWLRLAAPSGESNEVYVGMDGTVQGSVSIWNYKKYKWQSNTSSTTRMTIDVNSAGQHVLHLWMGKDGVSVDKILVTTDPAFKPLSGPGPAESPRY